MNRTIIVATIRLKREGIYMAGAYLLDYVGGRVGKYHQTVRTSDSRESAIALAVKDVIGDGPDAPVLRDAPIEDRGRASSARLINACY